MLLTYTIHTPMMQDARSQALRRATSEGWKRVSITAIKKVAEQTYEVSVVLSA